jgi:hypothetical protein
VGKLGYLLVIYKVQRGFLINNDFIFDSDIIKTGMKYYCRQTSFDFDIIHRITKTMSSSRIKRNDSKAVNFTFPYIRGMEM